MTFLKVQDYRDLYLNITNWDYSTDNKVALSLNGRTIKTRLEDDKYWVWLSNKLIIKIPVKKIDIYNFADKVVKQVKKELKK